MKEQEKQVKTQSSQILQMIKQVFIKESTKNGKLIKSFNRFRINNKNKISILKVKTNQNLYFSPTNGAM